MNDPCLNSPCAGLNGCTTHRDFRNINMCLLDNCDCTMRPRGTAVPTTAPPPCVLCGKINLCDLHIGLPDRNACLIKNCGNPCSDTFPSTPIPPPLWRRRFLDPEVAFRLFLFDAFYPIRAEQTLLYLGPIFLAIILLILQRMYIQNHSLFL